MRRLYLGVDREHPIILSWFIRLMDLMILLGSGWLAFVFMMRGQLLDSSYLSAFTLATVLIFSVFSFFDVYRAWRGSSLLLELRTVLFGWCSIFFILVLASLVTNTTGNYSGKWFLAWFCAGITLIFISRVFCRNVLDRLRNSGINQRRIVLVGASELGHVAAQRVLSAPWYGYQLVGFFSNLDTAKDGDLGDGVPFLGNSDQVANYVSHNDIDQVWVAMSMEKAETIRNVVASLDTSTVDVCYVPDIFRFSLLNHSISEVADIPLLNISMSPMTGINRLVKAILDRALAGIILLMISPLMAILAIGVKLSSPGPVFYAQERVSWNGKTFKMLKFRSMPVETEKDGVKWGGAQNKSILPFGKFIRKTSLDELPQFINVLMGHMSIVGPRPERTVFVEQFKGEIPGYMKKHKVKAGITGWAQVNGWRGDTDLAKRIECDLYYIENWSPWLDIKIILLTLVKGFINKNAY
ncbi:undecaprenyl-phosphate glucose phosphotransferase [Microbulbifer sp. MCCC 1A16149]|uniref:undecaprenyl-phosphate glucose phosphotransferase n=1 Tax=Microbulbifer sp. MCCC 1A16149 TaxID=3411322 RepID=UPI003D13E75C